MKKYQELIGQKLHEAYPEIEVLFSTPPDSEVGHLAIPCFSFAKVLKKSPVMIAEELRGMIEGLSFIDKVVVAGGYVNCFIDKTLLFKETIQEVLTEKQWYGSSKKGVGKKALVEHTSINPNASPHLGRARNAMIGDAIVRLLRFEGYGVDVHYFVNDVGKQIAMLVLGAKKREQVSFKDLLQIYVEINQELKEKPELEADVFDLLYRFEHGDEGVRGEFRKLVNICIEGQTAILKALGIEYDYFDYESDYIFGNVTHRLLDALKNTGSLEEDEEGRYVLNQEAYHLPMKSPYLVLTRKDKTSLYPLRDLAYSLDKVKAQADVNIIVLGEDQKLYCKQIWSALDLLGYEAPTAVHYAFVLLTDGKMSTRQGTVVLLEDFMEEAKEKARDEIVKRHGEADEKTAMAIGYGAVKYSILKASNDKNVVFNWESALSFEGDTGPYLQYTLARIHSILRNYGGEVTAEVDFSLLGNKQEVDLILEIGDFYHTIELAGEVLSPHIVANYVYTLAKKFSAFYHQNSVLGAESEGLKMARLALVESVRQVMVNCFGILGLEALQVM